MSAIAATVEKSVDKSAEKSFEKSAENLNHAMKIRRKHKFFS